jgi:hypothetical protein
VFIKAGKERVVLCLDVAASSLEFGNRHRLDELYHGRQSRPIRVDRGSTVIETEIERSGRIGMGVGEERLRAQYR